VIHGFPRCYSSNIPFKCTPSSLSIACTSKGRRLQFRRHVCYQVVRPARNIPWCVDIRSQVSLPRRYHALLPGSKIAHFKQLHKKTGIPYSEMVRWFVGSFLCILCYLFPSYFSTTRCGIERSSHWVRASDSPGYPTIRHLIYTYYFNKVLRSSWCIGESTRPASNEAWRAGELGTRKRWWTLFLRRRRLPTLNPTQFYYWRNQTRHSITKIPTLQRYRNGSTFPCFRNAPFTHNYLNATLCDSFMVLL